MEKHSRAKLNREFATFVASGLDLNVTPSHKPFRTEIACFLGMIF
jgi:hypothetical protein